MYVNSNVRLHHVTAMLKNCDYVRCLMIDLSHAFVVVDYTVLSAKLSKLDMPECIQNWIVSFLVGHSQCDTRSFAMADGLRDALVSIEKRLQSMNNLDIHTRSSPLLLLNGRMAYRFLFVDCCFDVFI